MKKVILAAVVLATIYGCGNSNQPKETSTSTTTEQTASAKSYEFTINAIGNTMADMSFDTKELKVTTGSKVKINLTNQGTDASMLHNIVIVKQGSEKDVAMEGINLKDQNYFNAQNPNVVVGSAVSQPGATVMIEFTAPEPGTYSYICTYPGHWMKMQGTLIVE